MRTFASPRSAIEMRRPASVRPSEDHLSAVADRGEDGVVETLRPELVEQALGRKLGWRDTRDRLVEDDHPQIIRVTGTTPEVRVRVHRPLEEHAGLGDHGTEGHARPCEARVIEEPRRVAGRHVHRR